ncbi:NCS2 family permease [Cuneatibacter caecimuris]|uniref:AGZA family xanthine/uracil permease-like MFS transporter n=1 Tax=Cuneatibacter caecimuris TaxID=1796618 RepID=A0A4Q7P3K0_9FIRM|nr:NCS2 family permease [Cuneatibacter caecimuris]RZS93990.1 AGZA family xanthine/uracil permease-like MFS transporter [Cuneatibacter caecimuris]
MLEKFFKLKENNTTVKTEVIAGLTTFMTMAYILAVNPSLLSAAGMDANAVLMATALASFLGTLLMALMANYPFALAPGMGLNAYFAFTVCGKMGYDWRIALLAVFIEGIIFIVLSLTNVREAIFNAIPINLKHAVSAGIGLFIAFIGLQGAHLVAGDSSTLLTMISFGEHLNQEGICAILAVLGLFITAVMYIKKVKGAILFGILITWILGMICQATGLYVIDAERGFYSLYPAFDSLHLDALGLTFGQAFRADFSNVNILNLIVVVFSFLFVDIFDTLGTLIGVSTKANMLDKNGKLPRIKPALLADAVATSAGAILGTSTTTTFVESSSGVAAGGRTGLASVVTAVLFLLSIFLAPVFTAIPGFATAPALIFVGFLMLTSILKVDMSDPSEGIPAYLCVLVMPLFYSIAEGIAVGVISYVVLNVCCGKAKKVTPLMYVLFVLFILKYIFL